MRSLKKFVLVKRRLSTWQPCRLNYHRAHFKTVLTLSIIIVRGSEKRPFTYIYKCSEDARPHSPWSNTFFFFSFFFSELISIFFSFLRARLENTSKVQRRHTHTTRGFEVATGTMKLLIYLNMASCPFTVKIYARRRVNCKPII